MIDGVIFDKDGTLFDFRRMWSGWAVALLRDLAPDPVQSRSLGEIIGFDAERMEFAHDSPVIAGTPDDIALRLLPHLPGQSMGRLVARMNDLAVTAPLAQVPPLQPYLAALRAQGLRLGLVTNDAEAPARAHLAEAGIAALFDFVAGFDSGHGAKPAPGPLLAFAERMGLAPERVVMVGDSLHDLRAGRAAGMRTVGVLTGIAGVRELGPHADVVLPDIGALPEWLAEKRIAKPPVD